MTRTAPAEHHLAMQRRAEADHCARLRRALWACAAIILLLSVAVLGLLRSLSTCGSGAMGAPTFTEGK
jgi:hypothetical protein